MDKLPNSEIIPISLKQANEYVTAYHRHHNAVRGCKFCIGLIDKNKNIIGVAICGRPVSRHYDNGTTLEINRLCTNGYKNACSRLYGACVRIAKEMGYKKVYITCSEDNIPSSKVIENNGGKLVDVLEPDMVNTTKKTKRYCVDI